MSRPNGTSRSTRRLLVAFVAVLALASSAAACGDDDETDSADRDESALVAATDDLVATCQDRDHARLRDLSGAGIQDRLRDQDRVFNDDVEDITVIDRRVDIDDDTATVTVTLEVTIDGEVSEVERVWEYERIDGVWVLSAVPDCIFS